MRIIITQSRMKNQATITANATWMISISRCNTKKKKLAIFLGEFRIHLSAAKRSILTLKKISFYTFALALLSPAINQKKKSVESLGTLEKRTI